MRAHGVLQGFIAGSNGLCPILALIVEVSEVEAHLLVVLLLALIDGVCLFLREHDVLGHFCILLEVFDTLLLVVACVHEHSSVVVVVEHLSDSHLVLHGNHLVGLHASLFIGLSVGLFTLGEVFDTLVEVGAEKRCVERHALSSLHEFGIEDALFNLSSDIVNLGEL